VTIKCRKLLPIELETKATELQTLEKQQIQTTAQQAAQIESLTKENASFIQTNQTVLNEINAIVANKKELQKNLEDLYQKKEILEEEKTKWSNIRDTVQKEYEDVDSQFTILQSKISGERDIVNDLTNENVQLKIEEKKAMDELEQTNAKITKQEKDIEKTKEDKKKKKSKPSPLNISTKEADDQETFENGNHTPSNNEIKATAPLMNANAETNDSKSKNCQCCVLL